MGISDEAIRKAAEGDRACQQLIYESLHLSVSSLVARIVGRDAVEDVTQDVFIQVFDKLHTFEATSSLTTWVYRVAVNQALQSLRRAKRRSTVELDDVASSIDRTTAELDIRDLMDVALSRIDAELKIALLLKEVDKLSYEEIAEIVGIPVGTVGSRLNRARRDLREQLLRLGWEG